MDGGDTNSLKELQESLNVDKIAYDKGNIYPTIYKEALCPSEMPKAISVNFEYYDNYKTEEGIKSYADKLAKVVDVLYECTKSPVNIVAHSMGGLIAREYVVLYGSDKINKLIMLETPNFGSPLAKEAIEKKQLAEPQGLVEPM